jgi:outer membrane protein OmpA-like peptidoglycan-associated protein
MKIRRARTPMSQDAPARDVVKAAATAGAAGERFPFIPWGLAPLIGLVLVLVTGLFPFAFGEIQNATAISASRALTDGGFAWANASVSGQWVTLEGKPPSRAEADAAIAAVARARSPTFLGDAEPATWVIARFTWTEDPLLPGQTGQPRIGGVDPSSPPNDPAVAPPPAAPRTAAAIRCDQSMADLLGNTTIQFASNSAVIRSASSLLLDGIARAAKACPGPLRIEGHTDNVGRDASNTTLSLKRAEAVRTALIRRGVEAERLVAEGFGYARPVAGNDSEAGRARNRRIEIRAIGASPT